MDILNKKFNLSFKSLDLFKIVILANLLLYVNAIPLNGKLNNNTRILQRRGLDISVNPYDGAVGHIDDAWVQELKSAWYPDATTEGRANTVMKQSTAIWIDTIQNLDRISTNMQKARQRANSMGRPVVIQFVVYDLPGRDCHALSSNGELSVGEDAKYVGYINRFAELLSANAADNVRVVLVVEPDSLPNISTNMANPKCAAAADGYRRGVAYALAKLSLPNVWLYIDIAHGGWLGWDSGKESAIPVFQSVLADAKQQAQNLGNQFRHAGWASNTANYSPINANGVPPAKQFPLVVRNGRQTYDYNPCIDELTFTSDYAALFRAKGIPARFIIDTSRNGVAGIRSHWGHWCNIRGAGIGYLPTVKPYSHIDAYVWIKPPGESDGHSTGSPRDGFCDPTDSNGVDALPDAPHAGSWFNTEFVQLVQNANPPLADSGKIKLDWKPELYALGCDWEGNDLTDKRTTSDQCGGLCASTSGCTHFTWTSSNGGTCWMKYGYIKPEDAKNTGDQSMVCGYMNYAVKIDWKPELYAFACDWKGNDLTNQRTSSDKCGGLCASTSGCTHFTWTTLNGGTCWMKSGPVSSEEAISTSDPNMVCGYMNYVNWGGQNWAWACDWKGNDIGDARVNGESCGPKCADTPGCTHFTWTTSNGGTCWMKGGQIALTDAFKTNDGTMVCGYVDGTPTSNDPIQQSPASGGCTASTSLEIPSMKKWMSKISADTAVYQAFIPGTHDSGTYATFDPFAGCQDWSIKTQLENGARYLDARVKWVVPAQKDPNDPYDPKNPPTRRDWYDGKVWVIHGIQNFIPLTDFLSQVYTFLDDNRDETVFLRILRASDEVPANSMCQLVVDAMNTAYFYKTTDEKGISNVKFPDVTFQDVRGKIVPLYNEFGLRCGGLGFTFGESVHAEGEEYSFFSYDEGSSYYHDRFAAAKKSKEQKLYLTQSSGYISFDNVPRNYALVLNPIVENLIANEIGLTKKTGYKYDIENAPKGIHGMDFPSEEELRKTVELSLRVDQALAASKGRC
ncbi:hypothetical protein HK098_004901 [Nowakowskiella sp. JEL0407]|nr:hypothetical protein HK098_004901 [Nowakowskiella sp. JEL0407]